MLRGEKVLIRAIERDDLTCLNAWWNEPELRRAMGDRRHISSLDETEAWFEAEIGKSSPSEGRTFAIADLGGDILGTISYGSYDTRDRACDVGMYLGEPDSRGKGCGAEALRLMLGYLFGDLGLNRVRLLVHPSNDVAIRCYEKVGFVREGYLRQCRYYAGKFHDFLVMAMLAGEWKGE